MWKKQNGSRIIWICSRREDQCRGKYLFLRSYSSKPPLFQISTGILKSAKNGNNGSFQQNESKESGQKTSSNDTIKTDELIDAEIKRHVITHG